MTDRPYGLPDLYAYVGEDEMGSGEIGIKQGMVPAGMIPLVSTSRGKLDRWAIRAQLQDQADTFGKTIRLIRFVAVEEIIMIEPKDG